MELKSVTEDDAEFLFELLKQREGRVNISHKSTPDWEEHLQYVKNHDYQSWDIIWIDETRVGNIYLTKKDEIGIFIDKNFQSGIFCLNNQRRQITMIVNISRNAQQIVILK